MKNTSKLALLFVTGSLMLFACGQTEKASSEEFSSDSEISEKSSSIAKQSSSSQNTSSSKEEHSNSSIGKTSSSDEEKSSSEETTSSESNPVESSSSETEPISSSEESISSSENSSSSEETFSSSSNEESSSSEEQMQSSSEEEQSSSSEEPSSSSETETSSSEPSSEIPSSSSDDPSSSSEEPVNYYTVAFDSQGGTQVPTQTIAEGELATKPEDPTKDDCTFDGWYLSTKYTKEFDFDKPITTDYVLFAKWISSSTGGDADPDPVTPAETYVDYWIAGNFCSWSKDGAIQMIANPDGNDKGMKLGVEIEAGKAFKITDFSSWYGYRDELSSVASSDNDGNIVVKETATYNIYLNEYDQVWVEKTSSIATSNSNITGNFNVLTLR